MKDRTLFFSTLWIFVTLNYLYCDLIGLMDATLLNQYLRGEVDGLRINEEFLLYAGILMEIPIAMVLLSRMLAPKPNAWCNLGAGCVKTAVMIATLFVGSTTAYYQFFATIEIATTIFISWTAFQWLKELKAEEIGIRE
jgi:hypothetical protein